jgi:ABC-2 type transport system permease protein
VFEGMRAVLIDGTFRWDHFWIACALNVLYVAAGAVLFAWAMRDARNRGTLLQMGE